MSKGRVYLLLGVVLAAISAGMVYMTVQNARPKPVPTRPVLVATQVIPSRTFVTAENSKTLFTVANWPLTIVPVGALTSPTQALQHVVVGNVEKGAPVFTANLSSDQTAGQTGLSIDLPAGDVAVSIPVSAVNAAGGAISPGDFIDMLVSVKVPDTLNGSAPATSKAAPAGSAGSAAASLTGEQTVSLTTLQHVKVLAMGQNTTPAGEAPSSKSAAPPSNAGASTMTLLLSHQDALLVKYAKDSGSTMDIVLRRYDDTSTSTTKPVDLNYFLTQFGYHLVAPTK